MTGQRHASLWLTFISVAILIFSSCNNTSDIPFPEQELGYSQPVSVQMQLGAEKKLKWDTAKRGGIKPVIKKLDIDALPALPYDTSGFVHFLKSPAEARFDFNSLPEKPFRLEDLPSQSLQFKTSLLASPGIIKVLKPSLLKGKALSIFDFGQAQGLPARFIPSLLKDKNGLMWIASTEGLYRYDGEHLQTFIPGPDAPPIAGIAEDNSGRIWYTWFGGLGMIDINNGVINISLKIKAPANNLARITKDAKGLLWVANNAGKAVSVIDPEALTFKNIDIKNGLSDSTAFEIMEDGEKNIWISASNGGADIINFTKGTIRYLKKAGGISNDTLTAMATDKYGQVWLASANGGVDALDIKNGIVKRYTQEQGFKKRYPLNLSFDNQGRMWMGSSRGIQLLDPEKGLLKYIDANSGLAGNTILSCTPDNYNRMWVATSFGLNIIAQNGETVHPIGQTIVITMMEDQANNLWIGTEKGIAILDAKRNSIRYLNKSNGLANDFVQSFTVFNQQMYVSSNGGLDIIDPIRKTLEHTGKNEGMVNDTTYVVFRDKEGNTLLTGPSNGIDLIDAAKNIILHTDVEGGLSDNNILDVKQDNNGDVWLATYRGGINIINIKSGTVRYLNNLPGLKDACSKMQLYDKQGRMWIGTDKGIYVADTKSGTITSITNKNGLINNHVLSLLQYNESIIAGTTNGASIITAPAPGATSEAGKAWKIETLSQSEGLIREQVNAWTTDAITSKGEYLWGDRGISAIQQIKAGSDSVSTYITGIHIMTVPQNFINKNTAGSYDTLWTADTFYLKGKLPDNTGYAKAAAYKWDSVYGPFNLPANLTVPYQQNYVHFEFVQAHLGRQDTVWYSYFLEGIDKKWSAPTTNTLTENYLNLPPQKYTFKVSSKGINGKWGNPATFSFTISPPWYQTWWAYTLFALLAAGLLRAYIIYRSRTLQRENRLLEEKVNLRTNQLQKSIADLKGTQTQLVQSEKMASLGELTAGIAHEIQNPLNFVNNFSEINSELIAEMKIELQAGNNEGAIGIANDIAANEQKINHHGKRADAIVKGMLQHSRSSSGQKEPTDINALADEYLRLAYHGLRAKDKSFNATMKTDYDETIGKINVVPQDIGRVILNLITNAFYAAPLPPEGGFLEPDGQHSPTVWVSTKKIEDKVFISVKDNGPGISSKVLDKIFQPFFTTKPTGQGTGLGLSLSYDIVKAHGGELNVKTREGEGAEFIIELPA